MVAGVEKYFQIARCFRDEDLRADRQMEFTQVDVEASFVDREDIYALFEGMLKKVWKDVLGTDIPTPFPRMQFTDAMNRFGVDKPDLRFGLELRDFSETFKASSFKVFQGTVASGGAVKALNAKGLADMTQGELKALEEIAKSLGAKGLAFIKVEGGEWKSPIVKFLLGGGEGGPRALARGRRRRHHLLRGGPLGEGLRDPGQDPPRGAALLQKRGQARASPRRLEVPLGRRFSPDDLRRGKEVATSRRTIRSRRPCPRTRPYRHQSRRRLGASITTSS
jgi:aspartyl-tRNA synthetase